MAMGPGKHDHFLTPVMKETGAHAAILIVLAGKGERSFCVQAVYDIAPELPSILRSIADNIERTIREASPIQAESGNGGDSVPEAAARSIRPEPPEQGKVQ